MDTGLRERVERAFSAAIAATENAESSSPANIDLTAICDGDDRVRGEVASLLQHFDAVGGGDNSTESFLNPEELHGSRALRHTLAQDALLTEWGGDAIGQSIDNFTIIGMLGEGGMGIVFVAEQQNPRRTVALKLMRRATATPALIRRFEREAQLLGRLNHPGVAQIFAAGIAQIQQSEGPPVRAPYIAMELVDGPDILQFVQRHGSPARATLELTAQACDAIQHAHTRGVIHRDLKPANILIAGEPSSPQVKVLDFGVARPIGEPLEAHVATQITAHGHFVGTLAYIAPEQLRSGEQLDTRCDVYSLGVLLYRLLSGRFPIDVTGCGIAEAARRIAESEPSSLTATDGSSCATDLQTICKTALEKDPSRRYQSPGALAADIRLYLAGEPIEARRESLLYAMRRKAIRYRNLALGAAIVLLLLLWMAMYAHRQQTREAQAHADADAARRHADDLATKLSDELVFARIEQGRLLGQSGNIGSAERFLWDEWLAHLDLPQARWALWELYSRSGCVGTTLADPELVLSVSVDPKEPRFASGGNDGAIKLWSLPELKLLASVPANLGVIRCVRFFADGASIIATGEKGAAIFDSHGGKLLRRLGDAQFVGVNCADVSPDGKHVATSAEDGNILLFRASDGALVATIAPPPDGQSANSRSVRFAPTGNRIAAGFDDGTLQLWDLGGDPDKPSITARSTIRHDAPTAMAIGVVSFSPHGDLLAAGSADRHLYLIDPRTGAELAAIDTHNGTARSVSFSVDGSKIAVAGYYKVQIYDVATRQLWTPSAAPFFGTDGGSDAAFSGDYLIGAGAVGTIHVWDIADHPACTVLRSNSESAVRALATLKVGDLIDLAIAQLDGTVTVNTIDSSASSLKNSPQQSDNNWERKILLRETSAWSVALSPDHQLIVGDGDGLICVLDGATGSPLQQLTGYRATINDLVVAPDGKTLASCDARGWIKLWHRDRADVHAQWTPGQATQRDTEVLGLRFDLYGRTLLSTERHRTIALWSVPQLQLLDTLSSESPLWKPALSSDGRWISVGMWDRSIEMWLLDTAAVGSFVPSSIHLAASLVGHNALVTAQAFNVDSTLLASASQDGSVKIWDIPSLTAARGIEKDESRHCLATLPSHGSEAIAITFLPPPKSQSLAVGYRDGTVRVWDLHHYDQHIEGQLDYQRQRRRR